MNRTTALVLGSIFVIVLGICIVGAILFIAEPDADDVALLGDDTFDALETEPTAATIEQTGPLLLSDVAGGSRDLIVQHLGDDPESGWLAFEARPPGADRGCFAEWQPDDEVFEDTCSGETYPADGAGLTQYQATVEDDQVVIDLRQPVG